MADQPRDTDIESVREQAENPPMGERPRSRRRTAGVADVRVNQEAGTPVDQMAREIGAEPVPEMGRAPLRKRNAEEADSEIEPERTEADAGASRGFQPTTDSQLAAPVAPREARRVLKARREHSKGDGNFPVPEPSARSAPKGNVTAGQDDRNPNLETRDDQRPGPPSRAFSLDAARDAAAMPNAAPRSRPIAEAKRAASTRGQVKDAPGRPEKAEKPKADRSPSMPKPRSRTVAKKAKGAAVKRATAKRAMPKRAMPKRAGTSRTAARKRTTAKRAGKRKR